MEISPLIIGTMRLGAWGEKFDARQWMKFIEQCLEIDLDTFDHADIYGDYTTEEDFGHVLKENPSLRDQMKIITKCGIKKVSENRPSHQIKSYDSSADHIRFSVENSLKYLNTDRIDLLLLHRPDFLMDPDEVADAFAEINKEGKVLEFGVSNFTPSQFDLLHSQYPLVTNQVQVSITHLEPFIDGTLDQALKLKVRPTAWSPLGGGTLFSDNKPDADQRIWETAQPLKSKYDLKLDQLLLAWLLQHPSGIIPVLGTSKIERISSAKKALNVKLDREDWYRLWQASTGEKIP